jgi:hypothetical protein
MTDNELINSYQKIYNIFAKYKFSNKSIKVNRELRDLDWLDDFITEFGFKSFNELRYFFINRMNCFHLCERDGCFQKKSFKSPSLGYSKGCNRSHLKELSIFEKYGVYSVFQLSSIQDKIKRTHKEKYGGNPFQDNRIKLKIKQTNLEKYGVLHFRQSKEYEKKYSNTCLEKYGVTHYSKTDNYKEKYRNTCLEKYGVEYPLQNESILNKLQGTNLLRHGHICSLQSEKIKLLAQETNLKKYGVINPAQCKEIQEKTHNTNLERYGYKYPYLNNEVRLKIERTNMERYGVTHYSKTDNYKEKYRNTCLEKYGVSNPNQRHIENIDNLNEQYLRTNFIDDNNRFLNEEACVYFNCSKRVIDSRKILFGINNINKTNSHETQQEIFDLFDVGKVFNSKEIIYPLELDIYYPNHNLAIEYDGLMFHSFGKSKYSMFNNHYEEKFDKLKHLKKTNLCKDRGIQLLHIFESEWLDETKREIWKSIISNKLGLIKNKVYARKCLVKEIDNKTKSDFLNKNHLQGQDVSKIKLGLFYNDELVSVMTFGKSRFNKNYEYELIRFANKTNTNVIGGASKLFSYFKKQYLPSSIITFADKRYSNGNLYKVLGFNYLRESPPNYFYFDLYELRLRSRVQFQKHKLKDILEIFDKTLTESENMFNNGYRRIWDCGNYVYGLNL